jgi:hypothetical protein
MGPPVALTAATSASASAPSIDDNHMRYDVTLADTATGKGGFVSFAAAAAGDYILFTNAAVQLAVTDASLAPVTAESSAASITECTTVKGRHLYELKVGTYIVGISGASASSVSFVVEAAAHEH